MDKKREKTLILFSIPLILLCQKFRKRRVAQWVVTFLIGVATGITAYLIDIGVTSLSSLKLYFTTQCMLFDDIIYSDDIAC